MKEIRQAEAEADEIRQKAQDEARQIMRDAERSTGKQTKSSGRSRTKRRQILEEAEEESKRLLNRFGSVLPKKLNSL